CLWHCRQGEFVARSVFVSFLLVNQGLPALRLAWIICISAGLTWHAHADAGGVVGFALTTLFFLKFNRASTFGGRFPRPGRWASMSSNDVNAKCQNVRFYGYLGQKMG